MEQFINTLKEAPYSDNLIDMWLETFKEEQNLYQFLQAIELNNRQWEEFKANGVECGEYVNLVVKHYTEEQGIPFNLVIPILIGSCEEIRDTFLAQQALKSITHIKLG